MIASPSFSNKGFERAQYVQLYVHDKGTARFTRSCEVSSPKDAIAPAVVSVTVCAVCGCFRSYFCMSNEITKAYQMLLVVQVVLFITLSSLHATRFKLCSKI
jgi:hypothetical protein